FMTARSRLILGSLWIAAALCVAGCARNGDGTTAERLTCQTTPDCIATGGTCVANKCHADNECASDVDCAAGQTCVTDADFGGLCTAAGAIPQPLPAWSCATGKDCPESE